MPAVQMNTRIDEATKERGDAVFAEIGYSPSQVVRIVWQFAADNAYDPGAVRRRLESMTSEGTRAKRLEQKMQAISRSESLYEAMLAECGQMPGGVVIAPELDAASNEVLHELAFEGRGAKYGME